MQTVKDLPILREAVDELRKAGPIAFVPTMGALHEGHLALIRQARNYAPGVVVSIFVNPTQFGPGEDLDAYPRRLEADSKALQDQGVALLWAPDIGTMYPQGFATTVSVSGVSAGLCGASRSGHFDGVATVVAKLFAQVRPDFALFGEKDWQQLAVIRRMARDLDLTHPHVENVIGVPTVREADGLAMSSRNTYLSPADRENARALPETLQMAARMLRDGHDWAHIQAVAEDELLTGGFRSIDYFELRDADSLEPLGSDNGNARLFAAARIGGTRLIDNMAVEAETASNRASLEKGGWSG